MSILKHIERDFLTILKRIRLLRLYISILHQGQLEVLIMS